MIHFFTRFSEILKSWQFRLAVFLLFSVVVLCNFLASNYAPKGIGVTLSGGAPGMIEHYSADYKDNHSLSYAQNPAGEALFFPLKQETSFDGHRLDFGSQADAVFFIRELFFDVGGFTRYKVDPAQVERWVRSTHDVKKIQPAGGGLIVQCSGSDPYLIMQQDFLRRFAVPETNIPASAVAKAVAAEVLLILLLLALPRGVDWLQSLYLILETNKKAQIKTLIAVAFNLLFILPVLWWNFLAAPDRFIITMRTAQPDSIQLYTKTARDANLTEKRMAEIRHGKLPQFTTFSAPLPAGSLLHDVRIDFGFASKELEITEIAFCRKNLFRYTLDFAQAQRYYAGKHQVIYFDVKHGFLHLRTQGNDAHLVPDAQLFPQVMKRSFTACGVLLYCLIAELLLIFALTPLPVMVFNRIRKWNYRAISMKTALYLGLNLVAVLPLFLLYCSNMADEFSITMQAEKDNTLELCFTSEMVPFYSPNFTAELETPLKSGIFTARYKLPAEAKPGEVRIDFASIAQKLHIYDISLTRGIIRYKLDKRMADQIYGYKFATEKFIYANDCLYVETTGIDPHVVPTAELFFKNLSPHIAVNKVFGMFCLIQVVLIIFAVYSDRLWRANKWELKQNLLNSSCTALAAACFFCVCIPVQTLLANRESFHYSAGELLLSVAPYALLVLLLLTAVLFILRRVFSYIPHLLVLGITVYVFLETGILSIGLPPLNGTVTGYGILSRICWDTAILLVLLIVPACFVKTLKKYIVWCAAGLLVMSVATCFDSKKAPAEEKTQQVAAEGRMQRQKALASVRYSPKRNIMLFILDSVTVEVMQDVMQNPDIAALYPGFVNYTNNVGMHMLTRVGIPGIMTGRYFQDPGAIANYTESAWSDFNFAKNFIDRDAAVFINLNLPEPSGYANFCKAEESAADNKVQLPPMQRRMSGMLVWNLAEICRFRCTPYLFKKQMLSSIMEGWDFSNFSNDISNDPYLFDLLAKKQVDPQFDLVLNVHHSNGSHPPFIYGANGEKKTNTSLGYAAYYEQTCWIARILGRLFEEYRKKGIYDNALIIVAADHGLDIRKNNAPAAGANAVKQNAFPCLMIKPAGAKEPFSVSDLPASHTKISTVIKMSQYRHLTRKHIETILRTKKRMYREWEDDTALLDWVFDEKKNVSFTRTVVKKASVQNTAK